MLMAVLEKVIMKDKIANFSIGMESVTKNQMLSARD